MQNPMNIPQKSRYAAGRATDLASSGIGAVRIIPESIIMCMSRLFLTAAIEMYSQFNKAGLC